MANQIARTVVAIGIAAAVSSCGGQIQPAPQDRCTNIGKRLQKLPVHGAIYGPVGAKVIIAQCGKRKISFAFIGEEPEDYQRLARLAEQRTLADRTDSIIGFVGVADGFIVEESPTEPVLLLMSLDNLAEDATVTARYKRRAEEPSGEVSRPPF